MCRLRIELGIIAVLRHLFRCVIGGVKADPRIRAVLVMAGAQALILIAILAENEIVGEALIALRHEELKEMGIVSIGHRLTILKGVYDVKQKQGIPIDSDHWMPPCMSLVQGNILLDLPDHSNIYSR